MKSKTMPIFHSPIAGEMLRAQKNIPHRREDLGEKGDTNLKVGYNVTGYFPNRRVRRSDLNTKVCNNRPLTNERGVNPRAGVLQRVWNAAKERIVSIFHKFYN
jgi:hypothetical protein